MLYVGVHTMAFCLLMLVKSVSCHYHLQKEERKNGRSITITTEAPSSITRKKYKIHHTLIYGPNASPPSPGRRLGPGPQAGHQRGEINRHWPALTIMAAARVMDRPAAARGLSFTYKLYVIRRRKKTNTGQTSVTDRLKKRHKLVLFGKRAVPPSGCIVE